MILVPSVAGYSFGAFTPDTSKTTHGNVSFRIGLINPGKDRLKVNFESRGIDNGEVFLPSNLSLKPSELGSTAKEGWISVGPNRYVKPRWITFYVLTENEGESSFSVRAEARKPVINSEDSVAPEIVQVRQFRYSLKYPEQRFSKDRPDENQQTEIFRFGKDGQAEENKSAESNKTMIFGQTRKEAAESSKNMFSTLLMGALAAASVLYLWRSL